MSMTVRKLIAELRKMPQNATVVFAAHDQDSSAGEYDGHVNGVDKATPQAKRHHGAGVVIR